MKFVCNKEDTGTYEVLSKAGERATSIEIIVPFFTDHTLIESWLKKGKKIDLTIALKFPTNPKAIKCIYTKQNLSIRFVQSFLHSKIYIFKDRKGTIGILVGSSNCKRETIPPWNFGKSYS